MTVGKTKKADLIICNHLAVKSSIVNRNPSNAPRYKEGLLMGFVDGTHNYRIWDTKSNSVITSRDFVFTHHSTTSDIAPEIVQVPDDDIIETTEMPVSPQRQLLRQFSRVDQQETLRPIPDNIDDDDPLNLQLDEGGIDPHLFSAHALLASTIAPQSYLQARHSGEWEQWEPRCKKSLQRSTNTKSGKSSLDHPICASWEHVGCLLERLMEKPANHRHTKLDGLPKDSVKSRELISTNSLLQLHTKTQSVFLSLVNHLDLERDQVDIKAAFLNGDLDETIYFTTRRQQYIGRQSPTFAEISLWSQAIATLFQQSI